MQVACWWDEWSIDMQVAWWWDEWSIDMQVAWWWDEWSIDMQVSWWDEWVVEEEFKSILSLAIAVSGNRWVNYILFLNLHAEFHTIVI